MQTSTQSAPAKINLTLDILRRRPDGYHDLQMVMQTVSLADTVQVTVDHGQGISVQTIGADLPNGPDNLAWRAADTFFQTLNLPCPDVEIILTKRIPMQAGLAGGSADAAAVLRILNTLLTPTLSLDQLTAIGALVGSDVPYCICGKTALVEGRGDHLTPLPAIPNCTIVLSKPDFSLSTPALFHRVRIDRLSHRPNTAAMIQALEQGDLSAAAREVGNVFEQVLTPEESSTVANIRDLLLSHGALAASMSGSGPTVFGLFDSITKARSAANLLPQDRTWITQPV